MTSMEGNGNFRIKVAYLFDLAEDQTIRFDVDLDLLSTEVRHYSPNRYRWTELDFHMCDRCSLDRKENPYCPAALSIVDIVEHFSREISFSRVRCRVLMSEKVVSAEKTLQEVLYSLMGLRMATSMCPFLSKFKPMARFHEPFSTPLYTIYRSLSMYFLSQYFQEGRIFDMELKGLKDFYEAITTVNFKMADRIKDAVEADAIPNSIMILSVFGRSVTYQFDKYLKILETIFKTA